MEIMLKKYWHIFLLILSVVYWIITQSDLFNTSVLCSGVLCVALVAKGNIWNYIVGLYNTIAYAYIAFNEHLYGEFILYTLFFLPTTIIGYVVWRKSTKSNTVHSKTLLLKERILLLIAVALSIVVTGYILSKIPNQNNPYMDSYITISSIVATILMIKRYSEQWILYILLNLVSILLWISRHIENGPSALSMIGMWSIFFINACFGWYTWSRKLKSF